MLFRKRWGNRLVALEFSTSRLSSCSPSSSRAFYGVFSPVADLLIGNSVENLEWIKQSSKMKYEARRSTMRWEISFFLSDELCCDECLQMVSRCEAWQRVVGQMESVNSERALYTYQLRDQRLMVIALRSTIAPLQGSANVLSASGMWQWL